MSHDMIYYAVLIIILVVLSIIIIVRNVSASDLSILSKSDAFMKSILEAMTEAEWNKNGKTVRKKNGGYKIDFERTVQLKKQNLQTKGVTPAAVLGYIQQNGGNPKKKHEKTVVYGAVRELIRQSDAKLNQNVSENGITPDEFFALKSDMTGDQVGVYVILNQTKSMYYVGQAKRLYFRVNQHFTGHGNGDVYADYKYGDQFRIKLITLRESGYDDLNKLERDMIQNYHANIDGYNKTAGNF